MFSKSSVYTVSSAVSTCIAGEPCVADAYCKTGTDILLHGACHITPNTVSQSAVSPTPFDYPAPEQSYFDCTIGAGSTSAGEGVVATVTCIVGQ